MNNKIHNQMFYLKRVRDCLEEIKMTPADQPKRFLLLKKKAEKYLKKAKEFEIKK